MLHPASGHRIAGYSSKVKDPAIFQDNDPDPVQKAMLEPKKIALIPSCKLRIEDLSLEEKPVPLKENLKLKIIQKKDF